MKTRVIMNRDLLGQVVRQDSKTMMFNANDMHKIGNGHRKGLGLSAKQLGSYFNLDATDELINAICLEDNIKIDDVKKARKGKDGGTWVHPVLFVDLAMWYSPALRVKILNWVLDGLIEARVGSANSFKKMNGVLSSNFENEFKSPLAFMKAANQVAAACQVGTHKEKWQDASVKQLQLREKIQENVTLLADMCPNAGTCLTKSIEKAIKSMREESQAIN